MLPEKKMLQFTPKVTVFQYNPLFFIVVSHLSSFESTLETLQMMNLYRRGSLPFIRYSQKRTLPMFSRKIKSFY